MAQCFMAGATSYDNQSLSDIVSDIHRWIELGTELIELFETTTEEIKNTDFFKRVPCEYKALIFEVPQICRTNIEDLKNILEAINKKELTKEKVELFRKIGLIAFDNNADNKKYYRSRDDGYWHDYDNADFRKIEKLYQEYGDYTATLWDVTNAAKRLLDYVDVIKDVTTVKYEDKSITIGNGNTIVGSAIGTNNEVEFENMKPQKDSLLSKISWNIVVPIIVGVIVAIIIFYLGLN